MKKILLVIVFVGCHLYFHNQMIANNLQFTFSFDYPIVSEYPEGTLLIYQNCLNFGSPSQPILPYHGVSTLIPQGHDIIGIEIVSLTFLDTLFGVKLMLADSGAQLGKSRNGRAIDRSMNFTDEEFSINDLINNIRTYYLSGHSISTFTICPVIYDSIGLRVVLVDEITKKI